MCDPGSWGGAGGWCLSDGTFGKLHLCGISGEFWHPGLAQRVPVLSRASCWVPQGTQNSMGRHPGSSIAPGHPLWGTTAAPFPLLQSDAATVSVLCVGGLVLCLSASPPSCAPQWHHMPLPPPRAQASPLLLSAEPCAGMGDAVCGRCQGGCWGGGG